MLDAVQLFYYTNVIAGGRNIKRDSILIIENEVLEICYVKRSGKPLFTELL